MSPAVFELCCCCNAARSPCADTMANAAVAAWTACIKKLQGYVDDPLTAPAMSCVAAFIDKLAGEPEAPMPNAAWKKLVHDTQVLLGTSQPDSYCYSTTAVLPLSFAPSP